MPAANLPAQGGESQITLFEIYSNYNKPVDVASGCIELNYYESILDNSVRVSATLIDTGFRSSGGGSAAVEEEDLKLTVGEKVHLKFNDGNQFNMDFSGDKQFRIEEVRNIDESNNKMMFTVDLFSKESIDNELELNRVKQRFDGKVSDSIGKILKENLKTPKTLDIDTTLNFLSFIGNVEKPFYKTTWLAPRSVPDVQNAQGNLAGFFFYETYDGFKYKSIDKLFQQEPKKKLIFNNLIRCASGEKPDGYDGKILDFAFDSTLDLKTSMMTGSLFNTKLKGVNTYESAYRENEFNYINQEITENMGGKKFPVIAGDLGIQNLTTKVSYKLDDQGSLVEGKTLLDQLPKSTNVNYNNDEILRQSYVRYNNLFTVKLSVAIAGDMSLRAGDLIHCDFPEISDKKNTLVSQKKGGVYMIVDVCHRITKNGCYTRMNLVRESIGRKPANMG
jgi:hypothetical protein